MTEKKPHKGLLVISRHAESEWNLLGKWTGLTDVNLTEKGAHESTMLGELLRDIDFDGAYTSDLKRTKQTLAGIIKGKLADVTVDDKSIKHHPALNERDYGDLTGKNKWEVKDEIGEEAFNGIRRGWDYQCQVAKLSRRFMGVLCRILKLRFCRGFRPERTYCWSLTETQSVL